MQSIPSWQQPSKATVDHVHSHSWPRPSPGLANMKRAKCWCEQEVTIDIPFLNTDPITCFLGRSNKAPIIIDRSEVLALMHSGLQVSNISSGFCEQMALKIHPLDWMLELEGMGVLAILYLGNVKVNLQFPGKKGYNEDVFLQVLLTMIYVEKVQVMVGSKIIDRAMKVIMKRGTGQGHSDLEVGPLKCGHASVTPIAPQTCRREQSSCWGETPSATSSPTVPKEFYLDDIRMHVCTTQRITIPPFETVNAHGKTDVWGQCMWVPVMAEPVWISQLPMSIVPTAMYWELHSDFSQVLICLSNLDAHPTMILTKVITRKVAPASQVAPVNPNGSFSRVCLQPLEWLNTGWVGPTGSERLVLGRAESGQGVADKMKASVSLQWFGPEKETFLIKHYFELNDKTSFKECYCWIPLHMYDDMRTHLQEMLDISAIWKLYNLWVSAVVSVQKKDGILRFCVNLRKLNNLTVKEAYLLLHIDESLNSLQESQWFSSLNLKSGYWQVKMDGETKLLTTFTLKPSGYFKCKNVILGLTKIPGIFQQLIEIYLWDLNLNSCIIYLDGTVIFFERPNQPSSEARGCV